MPKLFGVMSVFNDCCCLKKTLPALAHWVDELIIIDGPYAEFPCHGQDGVSDDGTWEFLKDFASQSDKAVNLVQGRIWPTEMAKRTEYLMRVPNGEWFFMLDADELLISVVKLHHLGMGLMPLREPFDCGIITALNPGDVITHHPRLFKKYHGMRYERHHVDLINDKTDRTYNEMYIPVVIKNIGHERQPERVAQRDAYYAKQLP